MAGWKIPELNGCFKGKTVEVNGGLSIGFMNHMKPIATPSDSQFGILCVKTFGYRGSSVKLMLSAEERQGLLDLGYSPEEA